jgi:hypothetical protein
MSVKANCRPFVSDRIFSGFTNSAENFRIIRCTIRVDNIRITYYFVLYIIVLSFVSHLHAGNVKISDQALEDPLDQLLGNSHFRKFMPNSAYFGADKMTILNKVNYIVK